MISFAGITSDEKFLVVEHYPRRYFPTRRYEVQTIPGRTSGDVLLIDGGFDDYKQPYQVFMDAKAPGLSVVSRGIAEWLLGNPGYQRLEDSYDPEFYRMAYYSGGEDFLNYFNEYGRGNLNFTCAPRRYFKSGENTITVEKNQVINSPSTFKYYPLISATFSGSGTITFIDSKENSHTLSINVQSGTVIIDPERHTANRISDGLNVNNKVTGKYEDMYLDEVSKITWSGGINSCKITPRWWTI